MGRSLPKSSPTAHPIEAGPGDCGRLINADLSHFRDVVLTHRQLSASQSRGFDAAPTPSAIRKRTNTDYVVEMEPTSVPVPPITLLETVDLDVFADVASAVHDIDLDDVRNGRLAFDSVGRPLRVVSNGDWPVDLVVAEDCEAAPGELEVRLRNAIRRLGADWVDSLSSNRRLLQPCSTPCFGSKPASRTSLLPCGS